MVVGPGTTVTVMFYSSPSAAACNSCSTCLSQHRDQGDRLAGQAGLLVHGFPVSDRSGLTFFAIILAAFEGGAQRLLQLDELFRREIKTHVELAVVIHLHGRFRIELHR